jgi:trans-aconitate 2-methyltransferase
MSWDVERYEARHSYVWNLGASLVELLDPKPGERILDLGCGSGQLTHQISESGAAAIGVDNAPAMIAQARLNYPKLKFLLADAAGLQLDQPVDGVFSNAALHWMRPPEPVVEMIARVLAPGGRLVAEFGGKGNIRTVLEALSGVLGGEVNPWYFPSIGEYASLLERHGLAVTLAMLFDRPTPLEGQDGMDDWMQMFCGAVFDGVPERESQELRRKVSDRLKPRLYRDGKWSADYKRLRVVAYRTGS